MIIGFESLSTLKNEQSTFVIGTFDILHAGHIHFLEKAKEVGGGKLLVAIIADEVVRSQKGDDRPFTHQSERAEIVNALKVVDYVFLAPVESIGAVSKKVIELVRPENAVASRGDWDNRVEDWETEGTNLILIDKIPERSTTKIVQKIRN